MADDAQGHLSSWFKRDEERELASPADGGGADPFAAENGVEGAGEDVCGPSYFEEEETCQDLLRRVGELLPPQRHVLVPSVGQDQHGAAAALEQFAAILDRYQESPHLLHPYLEQLVSPLVELLLRYLPSAAEMWTVKPTDSAAAVEREGSAGENRHSASEGEPGLDGLDRSLGLNLEQYEVDAPRTPLHAVCRALYMVIKVAGEKNCTSYLPHDVCYYEDVFYSLRRWKADAALRREWEVRYCLLLWMSNLVLVPFELSLLDSSAGTRTTSGTAASGAGAQTLSGAILVTATAFLADTSKCREGAALLVARLLTRPDSQQHRDVFLRYAAEVIGRPPGATPVDNVLSTALQSETDEAAGKRQTTGSPRTPTYTSSNPFFLQGLLLAIARTFKLGQRSELLPYVPQLTPYMSNVFHSRSSDGQLSKIAVKVQQRLVLALLPKRSATWKYQQEVISLTANLSATGAAPCTPPATSHDTEDDGDATDEVCLDDDQAESLEDGIGLLIEAMGHKNTVVRWSSAKGIGRVCERLPAEMAAEVVDAVFCSFKDTHQENRWHGALLTVAELCRRHVLPVTRLAESAARIADGLHFELTKGTYSVGANVRDAACYACWSIARAYNPGDLAAHITKLSTALAVTALFDREVNVRRAAAAAFQECVGRLGTIPDGIALVTVIDFFSLASLPNAYLRCAPEVATHAAYLPSIMEELVGSKLSHWDRRVRGYAAAALGEIAPLESTAVVMDEVVPELLRRVESTTLAARHGAILALAALVSTMPTAVWAPALMVSLMEVIVRLEASRLFRSRGGEYMRQACCGLIAACAHQRLPLPEFISTVKLSGERGRVRTTAKVQAFLEDTWRGILEWQQRAAADAFASFAHAYYVTYSPAFHGKLLEKLIAACCSSSSASPLERRGALEAIAGLPTVLLVASGESADDRPFFVRLTELLQAAAVPSAAVLATTDPELLDAESRRNAVTSLAQVLLKVPLSHPDASPTWYLDCLRTLLAGLQDYAVDKRGDVGSMVRCAALEQLPNVVMHGLASPGAQQHVPADGVREALQAVVKVLMEKLDRVRSAAGTALVALLTPHCDNDEGSSVALPVLPSAKEQAEVELLRRLVQHGLRRQPSPVQWGSPAEVVPLVAPALLQHAPLLFTYPTLAGLVVSAGDLSEHVWRPATAALRAAYGTSDLLPCSAPPVLASDESVEVRRERLSRELVAVATAHAHTERVLVPFARTVELVFNDGIFSACCELDVVRILRTELRHFATTITVVLPLITLLTSLCRSSHAATRQEAWAVALHMIASRYPKVRAKTATDLYTALLVLTSSSEAVEGLCREGCLEAMSHLTAVQWDGSDAIKIRAARNTLHEMLQVKPPLTESTATNEVPSKAKTEPRKMVASSYAHLVHDAGY